MIFKKFFWSLFFFSGAILAHWILNQTMGIPFVFIPFYHIPMYFLCLGISIGSKDD